MLVGDALFYDPRVVLWPREFHVGGSLTANGTTLFGLDAIALFPRGIELTPRRTKGHPTTSVPDHLVVSPLGLGLAPVTSGRMANSRVPHRHESRCGPPPLPPACDGVTGSLQLHIYQFCFPYIS